MDDSFAESTALPSFGICRQPPLPGQAGQIVWSETMTNHSPHRLPCAWVSDCARPVYPCLDRDTAPTAAVVGAFPEALVSVEADRHTGNSSKPPGEVVGSNRWRS